MKVNAEFVIISLIFYTRFPISLHVQNICTNVTLSSVLVTTEYIIF